MDTTRELLDHTEEAMVQEVIQAMVEVMVVDMEQALEVMVQALLEDMEPAALVGMEQALEVLLVVMVELMEHVEIGSHKKWAR